VLLFAWTLTLPQSHEGKWPKEIPKREWRPMSPKQARNDLGPGFKILKSLFCKSQNRKKARRTLLAWMIIGEYLLRKERI